MRVSGYSATSQTTASDLFLCRLVTREKRRLLYKRGKMGIKDGRWATIKLGEMGVFRNQSVGRGGPSVSYNRLQAERRAKQKRTCASLCVCGIGITAWACPWACAVIDYSVPEKNLSTCTVPDISPRIVIFLWRPPVLATHEDGEPGEGHGLAGRAWRSLLKPGGKGCACHSLFFFLGPCRSGSGLARRKATLPLRPRSHSTSQGPCKHNIRQGRDMMCEAQHREHFNGEYGPVTGRPRMSAQQQRHARFFGARSGVGAGNSV